MSRQAPESGVAAKAPMRVAVLYICTGRYSVFWPEFFKSAQRYLLPDHDKHFFVFSDADAALFNSPDVSRIYQERLGWPDATLRRFHMFRAIEDRLREFDYIFFFNANCLFVDIVDEGILPLAEEELTVVHHPGYYGMDNTEFGFERNSASRAFIPHGQGRHYVVGGINGGRTAEYCAMINELALAIDVDRENGITALWHDESHLNAYILNRQYKLLSPTYCCPEDTPFPGQTKILIRSKKKYGGHDWLREIPLPQRIAALPGKVCRRLRRLFAGQA